MCMCTEIFSHVFQCSCITTLDLRAVAHFTPGKTKAVWFRVNDIFAEGQGIKKVNAKEVKGQSRKKQIGN